MKQPTYVIASTPRSGSTLLAAGLVGTGIAGRPEEYFAPDQIEAYKEDLSLPLNCSWTEYVEAVMAVAATENGVRGVKIHWRHVVLLARALGFRGDPGVALESLFPAAAFVSIVRSDRRAQAISLFRAETTGEWSRSPGYRVHHRGSLTREVDLAGVVPTYAQIIAIERALDAEQAAWTNYFATRSRSFLTVRYEDLDANYRGEIARVLHFLGADPAHAASLPNPPLQRQSDRINERWRRLIDQEEHNKSTPRRSARMGLDWPTDS